MNKIMILIAATALFTNAYADWDTAFSPEDDGFMYLDEQTTASQPETGSATSNDLFKDTENLSSYEELDIE